METGLAKVPAVAAHVDGLLGKVEEGGGGVSKLLLFAHHIKVLDALAEHFRKGKTPYVRVDGQVASDNRQVQCDRFQRDESVRVALLSIAAAGVGLTLTAGSHVVFAECSWEIGKLRQAEDRAHRIGQTSSVIVQYMLAEGTLDDWMWRTVERKLEVTASTMDGAALANTSGGAPSGFAAADGKAAEGTSAAHAATEPERRGSSGGGDIRAWLGGASASSAGKAKAEAPAPAVRLHEALAQPARGSVKRKSAEVIDLGDDD